MALPGDSIDITPGAGATVATETVNAKEYQVNFKFFQRVEGTFKVAPEAVVKSLQIRVFENGSIAPKLLQTVSVS